MVIFVTLYLWQQHCWFGQRVWTIALWTIVVDGMERSEGGASDAEPSSVVQGRWVWKQVVESRLPRPSAAHRSSKRSTRAESEEPVLKKPRLESIDGGCWFRGGREREREGGQSFKEIADRHSSTSENPQAVNRTPTPYSASAAAMMSKRRDAERQERLADPRPMDVRTFNQYVASDDVVVTMGP